MVVERMSLAASLSAFDQALLTTERDGLRSPASPAALTGAATELGAPLPPSFVELYRWHDGESNHSSLIDTALRSEIDDQWGLHSEAGFEIRFMTLAEVKRVGIDNVWQLPDGTFTRRKPEVDGATKVTMFPFVWIQSHEEEDKRHPRELDDADWLIAVESARGKIVMYEVAGESLEEVVEQAPDLSTWLDNVAQHLVLARDAEEQQPAEEPAAEADLAGSPSMLLMRFLLDRNLIEMAEGATDADMATKLVPLLAIRPPKQAVRAVLETLTDSELVDEVFADDAMLSRIIIEFVD
jgi:hypothetical protein